LRYLVTVFCLLIAFIHGYGQHNKTVELYLGVSQGMSFSRMDFDPNERMLLLPGYYGGLFIIYKSQPVVGVKLEFNIVQKGWESALDSSQQYSRTLNYIEVPFTTHIMLGKKKSRFYIDFGPYAGYLNKESEKMTIHTTEKDYLNHPIDRKFDFGYCLAAAYQYTILGGKAGFELRYSNSLTNSFVPSAEFEYYSSRNQLFSVRFVYTVKIL